MTAKEVRDLVSNIGAWGGNTFTLAMRVAEQQREDAATIAETMGQPEVAEAIRAAT